MTRNLADRLQRELAGTERRHDWEPRSVPYGSQHCRRLDCGFVWYAGLREPLGCRGADREPDDD